MPGVRPSPRIGLAGRAALRALAAAAAIGGAVVAMRHVPLRAQQLADALGALGPIAAAILPAIYVPWMLLGIPTAPLALAAGFALGPVAGGLVAVVGCTTGACAAFVFARGIGRGAVARLSARVPAVVLVQRAVRSHGFRVVMLLRLAPVMPVPFLNRITCWG